jgi:hypothetical protein
MILAIETMFVAILLGGVWMLTAGTRRFNISPRLMTVMFALTALIWMGFLVTTIALLVYATNTA